MPINTSELISNSISMTSMNPPTITNIRGPKKRSLKHLSVYSTLQNYATKKVILWAKKLKINDP